MNYSNKKFGSAFFLIFIILGTFFFVINKIFLSTLCFIFSSIIGFLAIFFPVLLKPLKYSWFKIAYFLNLIFSPFIIGFIFFVFFTPFSMILKFLGRNELNLRDDPDSKTYWRDKYNNVKIDLDYFRKQF